MLTDTGIEPDPDERSAVEIRELWIWLDRAAAELPTLVWPSTPQQLHEIQQAVELAHGGPLATPVLPTWDEMAAQVGHEKAVAAAIADGGPPLTGNHADPAAMIDPPKVDLAKAIEAVTPERSAKRPES